MKKDENVFEGFPKYVDIGNFRYKVVLGGSKVMDAGEGKEYNGLHCIFEAELRVHRSRPKSRMRAMDILTHEISHALFQSVGENDLWYNENATECFGDELMGCFDVVEAGRVEYVAPSRIRMGHLKFDVVEDFGPGEKIEGDVDYEGFRIRVGKKGSVYREYMRMYNLMYAWVSFTLDHIGIDENSRTEIIKWGLANHMMTCLKFKDFG